jgi:endonuclease-8
VPEGDNIHRHQREFSSLLVGAPLDRVWVRGLEQPALRGRVVESVEAHGKHLLIGIAGGITVRVHLGIAGFWRRLGRDRLAPWQVAKSPLVLVSGAEALVCGRAKQVELLKTAFLRDHRALAALGPDLLGETVDFDDILRRARTRGAWPLAELLLSQSVASGLGNVYKSELCFLHRLSPFRRVDSLDDATLRTIYEDARRLLASNLGPGPRTTTADRSRGWLPPRGRGRHYVYDRARRPCYVCGTPIVVRLTGREPRRTFYCPTCQPDPPPADAATD